MISCIETIRIYNRRVYNIKVHNDRCNTTRNILYGSSNKLNLKKYIDTSSLPIGMVKCRITYTNVVTNIEYEPYSMKVIKTLTTMVADHVSYEHKYADRANIKTLFASKGKSDDILMIVNGLVTDTSYANVAFYDGTTWYTPSKPMLNGTMRSKLIEKGKVFKRDIAVSTIATYKKICLFNSMITFGKLVLPTSNISVKT